MSFQTHCPDERFSYNYKISGYAVNNLTHQLFVCDKECIWVYCLETNRLLREFPYAEKFLDLYDEKCKIKAVEACLFANVWITLINRRSFLFFNEFLSFSKIYKAEHNPVLSMSVIQRFDDIVVLRNDRKVLKFWKYEIIENNTKFQESSDEGKSTLAGNFKISAKRQMQLDRYQKLHEKAMRHTNLEEIESGATSHAYAVEATIWTKRTINAPNDRTIMQHTFSEDLQLLIMSLDNLEICIFSVISGDLLRTLGYLKIQVPQTDTPMFHGVANIWVDQELLYCCDDKRFIVHDLVLDQEVFSSQIPNLGKIVGLVCVRPSPHGGVFFLTTDELLHSYAYGESNKKFSYCCVKFA